MASKSNRALPYGVLVLIEGDWQRGGRTVFTNYPTFDAAVYAVEMWWYRANKLTAATSCGRMLL